MKLEQQFKEYSRLMDVFNVTPIHQVYTGEEIEPNFFRSKLKQLDRGHNSLCFWESSVDVNVEFMKDIDDIRQNLSIKSDMMQNFILQLHTWTDPVLLTFIQRLLVKKTVEVINTYLLTRKLTDRIDNLYIEGNDIMYKHKVEALNLVEAIDTRPKKLSVSITYPKNHVGMIHFGYNIEDTGAPDEVRIGSLKDLGLYNLQSAIVISIIREFLHEFEDILSDSYKSVS